MVDTRSGRRFAIFFFVAAFLLLLLGHWLEPVDRAAISAAAPFAAVVNGVSNVVGDAVSGIFDGPRLRDDNLRLKKQLAIALQHNAAMQAAWRENAQLVRMLHFQSANPELKYLPARIVAVDPNSALSNMVLVSAGTKNGVRTGMTVLDANGYFLGTVSDEASNTSKVLLLTSPSSSVGALDMATGASGLVEGQWAGRPQLRWVVASQAVHPGDFIITSGQMSLYPRHLLIGQVVSVNRSSNALFQTAEIQPLSDLQHLEDVQVVRNFVPSIPVKLLSH